MGSTITIHPLHLLPPPPPVAKVSNLLSLFQAPGLGFTAWYSVSSGCSHHACLLHACSVRSFPPYLSLSLPPSPFCGFCLSSSSSMPTGFLPFPSLTASALTDKLPEGNDLFCHHNRQKQVLSNSHFLDNILVFQVAQLVRAQRPSIKTCLSR